MARRRRSKAMPAADHAGPCCAVSWCAALAMTAAERRACMISNLAAGYCAVHAQEHHRELRPEVLAPGEELIDGSFWPCDACATRYFDKATSTHYTKSDGKCADCLGSGECGDQCGHGHTCSEACEACNGSGRCKQLVGSGYSGVRIREGEAA